MEVPEPSCGAVPAVAFENVGFAYAGAKDKTLQGLSFTAMPGETIGIIGGTGSGKSTLASLIPRFYDSTEGTIRLFGQDIRRLAPASIRRHIGIVPQKAALFSGSLRKNMQWGKRDASDEEIYQALTIAQAKDFVDAKGLGLDLAIQQGGSNLSGGQKQRLTIARALVGAPEILILDDSASALDFATDARLRKALKESTGHSTVFLISQRFRRQKRRQNPCHGRRTYRRMRHPPGTSGNQSCLSGNLRITICQKGGRHSCLIKNTHRTLRHCGGSSGTSVLTGRLWLYPSSCPF